MWQVHGYYNQQWVIIDYRETKRAALRLRREYTRAYQKPHRIRKGR